MDDNKRKALTAALSQIEKQFGKGSVMRMGDEGPARDIEAISTGSLGLDIALGIGGLPRGRVVEIYGPESSGKTTLTLQVIAEAQKAGGTAAFVDAEHALDPVYARKLGVNVDDLLVSQPDTGEDALEITIHKTTGDQLAFDVHRCRYAEMYDRLGLREMGFHLSCCRDAAFARGFNTAIRMQRRQTIMEGAPCCDFRFSLPPTP